MSPSWEAWIGRWADRRGILDKSDRGYLIVLLALWEHAMLQDDPLADKLLPLVDLSKKDLRLRTAEWEPQTSPGIISYYIKVCTHPASIQAGTDMLQVRDRETRPTQGDGSHAAGLPKSLFEMTVPELRWHIVDRGVPLDENSEMQWRGPLIAHLLIADALADDDLRHDPEAYRMLLLEVLGIVAMNS